MTERRIFTSAARMKCAKVCCKIQILCTAQNEILHRLGTQQQQHIVLIYNVIKRNHFRMSGKWICPIFIGSVSLWYESGDCQRSFLYSGAVQD
jgi:hypothetical protein